MPWCKPVTLNFPRLIVTPKLKKQKTNKKQTNKNNNKKQLFLNFCQLLTS